MRTILFWLSALVVALPLVGPARAEVVTLECNKAYQDMRIVIDVDLIRSTVTFINKSPSRTVQAEFTDNFVTWENIYATASGRHYNRLERATGRLYWKGPSTGGEWLGAGLCERLNKVF
jgi:hypothetical protein